MFFTFKQNKSYGRFDVGDNIGEQVIIEAESACEANSRAMSIGMYFNGVRGGIDCPCCGDRWRAQYSDSDGTVEPEIDGEAVVATTDITSDSTGFIHYADGRVAAVAQ